MNSEDKALKIVSKFIASVIVRCFFLHVSMLAWNGIIAPKFGLPMFEFVDVCVFYLIRISIFSFSQDKEMEELLR